MLKPVVWKHLASATLCVLWLCGFIRGSGIVLNPYTQLPLYQNAPAVYPGNVSLGVTGCETPTVYGSGHVWYSSPIGSDDISTGADGSLARPWAQIGDTTGSRASSGNQNGMLGDGMFADAPAKFYNDTGTLIGGGTTRDFGTGHDRGHAAPVHNGDVVIAMDGQHGYMAFKGWLGVSNGLDGFDGPHWTYIQAQHNLAALSQGIDNATGRFYFVGWAIESLNVTGSYTYGGGPGETAWGMNNEKFSHDTVYTLNHIQSASRATVNGWDKQTWLTSRITGINDTKSTCLAVTNNTVENAGFGIGTQHSVKVLIAGNTLTHNVDDGIDHGSAHVLIINNNITDIIEDGDLLHADGIQGVPDGSEIAADVNDTIIKNNVAIRITDANDVLLCSTTVKMCPKEMQGIGFFDGPLWPNYIQTDNVSITNDTNGQSFYGLNGAIIANNIVGGDSGYQLYCVALGNLCNGTVPNNGSGSLPFATPYIDADNQKITGTGSSNFIWTNNIAGAYTISNNSNTFSGSGNLCLNMGSPWPACQVAFPDGSGGQTFINNGTYAGAGITITGTTMAAYFKKYDTVNYSYNLRPGP